MGRRPDIVKAQSAVKIVERLRASPMFFLDESEIDHEALRSDFLEELAPRTPYEKSLAECILSFEWELMRYRKLRDAAVLARYRELALSVLHHGSPDRRLGYRDEPDTEHVSWVEDLCSRNLEVRQSAEQEFEGGTRYTCLELLALAFAKNYEAGVLENRIADLEVRRRKLREEYDLYRGRPFLPIEDAELVGEAT